ncbi:MAG: helix-turn-helix domain-containing protein [Bacilli bacterium]|nr:helix-turn-helix domain-containing protein [Bacilli bacterium]
MKELSEIVAENITNLRKSKGLTQQELAEKFNYSDKTVSKWELGQAIPSVDVLKQLGDYFGVTVDYFLHDEPDPEKAKYKIKSIPQKQNEVIITILASIVVALIATVTFVWSLFAFPDGKTPYWQAFVWMVPLASLASLIFVQKWFKTHKIVKLVLLSVFFWGILAGTYLHVFTYPTIKPEANIWYIFFIGIPIEVILVLVSQMKK